MKRKKVKLAWIENKNSRTTSLKKRGLGLVKKVKELSILCDVKACLIIFSRDVVEPMVWPSLGMTRGLLDDYFALPDYHKKKKETSIESYLKEKIKKLEEQLKSYKKKNIEYVIDHLMEQLQHGRRIVDLDMSEMYELLCFSRNEITLCRKKLGPIQHPPLRDPPMYLFESRSNENSNHRNCFLYQKSNSNGNPNMEIESCDSPVMIFHGEPFDLMRQSNQYQFDLMSREIVVQEEEMNINNGDPQFHISNYATESPPNYGTSIEEDNKYATSFEINMEINNHNI